MYNFDSEMKREFSNPTLPNEQNTGNNEVKVEINGIHVSSNGYYGFQPITQLNEKDENVEYMEVQLNDSDIQFNNFIQPESNERLGGLQTLLEPALNTNGKRPWFKEEQDTNFKKRRECLNLSNNNGIVIEKCQDRIEIKSHFNSNKDEMLEELLKQTHGSALYHWENNEF